MKIELITKQIIRNIVGVVIPFVILSITYFFIDIKKEDFYRQGLLVEQQIGEVNNDLQSVISKAKELAGSLRLWKQLKEDKKDLVGLEISKAQEIIQKYTTKYKILDLDSKFSRPEILKGQNMQTENAVIMSSTINLDFKGLSDEYVLSFINDIMKEIPGYINITSFSINRKNDITSEVLLNISKGNLIGIVDAKVEILWRDLKKVDSDVKKELENENSQDNENNQDNDYNQDNSGAE